MTKAAISSLSALGLCSLLVAAVTAGCGSGGSGARTGTGGSTGSGGSGATTGSGGSTGMGGSTGSGGSASTALDCTKGVAADPSRPLLTDFSDWDAPNGKWGMIGNLRGSKFGYMGAMSGSAVTATVDTTAMNLVLAGAVVTSDYAGGGMSFDSCVNTSQYTGIQFTLGGDVSGCDLFFQVQTSEQQASTGGACVKAADGTGCYSFPKKQLTFAPGPVTVMFSDLSGGKPTDPAAIAAEIVGLQWQFQSPGNVPDGGTQAGCPAVNMTIDDVSFVK